MQKMHGFNQYCNYKHSYAWFMDYVLSLIVIQYIIYLFLISMGLRNLLCIFVVVVLAHSFTLVSQQSRMQTQGPNKIPEYIGVGYNVLTGNPFTNHIDEGFKSPIFLLSYQKGQMTQDNKYLIPDFTTSRETIACSLESKVNEYTGSQNYQKELQQITKIDTRLSFDFLKAAFSFSRAFDQFTNSTQTHKQTSCQSNAECTVYTITMPIFSNQITLSPDFIGGVRQSLAKNDWTQFVEHFGTHYATSVTFGGRYFLEHTYSEESMSLFSSMSLDIKFAAQIQFYQKVGINLTEEMKKYQNQTSVINTKVDTTHLSIIGGLPPRSGKMADWINTVKDNLAPVSYQMTTTSALFGFIPNINATEANRSYNNYLNTYCQRHKCPPLTPDRPPPKPLIISFTKTQEISGQSKNPHTYDTNDGKIKVGMRVFKVLMGSQGSIDSIQFFLSDGIAQHDLPLVGNRQFNHEYEVPAGDEIKCIRFGITHNNPYWKFTSMQFQTLKGVNSAVYSGTYAVNEYQSLCINGKNEHFVGFYGHYGNTFDSIGLNIIKETMP